MPVTLDATPMGVASNSYATREQGDEYHETRLWSDTWTDADPADKDVALMMATRLLDTMFEWVGTISTTAQALLWPRRGVIRAGTSEFIDIAAIPDLTSTLAILLPSDEIPKFLYEACAEWARQLMVSDRTADSEIEVQGITHVAAGAVEVDFKDSVVAHPIPDAIASMVFPYGRPKGKGGAGAIHLYRA